MSHHCSAILIHCIDFRLQPQIKHWLGEQTLLGDCDVVAVAGASKDIDEGGEFVLKQVDIAYRLHGVRRVILMNHTDCGAYGGRMEHDAQAHGEIMTRAKEKILAAYPDVQVDLMLADIADDGTVSIAPLG